MLRSLSLTAVLMSGCVQEPITQDLWVDAGPDFAGSNLATFLHSSTDGHVLARLTARKFWGFQKGDSQVLEGVMVHFIDSDFKLEARRAEMISSEDVELRGEVHGRLKDGRGFRAPSVTYLGRTRTLKMDGPVEFYGEGHELRALGGATTTDRFDKLELEGPVSGRAQVAD